MKVVIAGATGFIGGEVLRQCLLHSDIGHVVALSRRGLPETVAKHPKLKTLIIDDFESYTEDAVHAMSGAQVCIWAIGGMVRKIGDVQIAQKVNVDYAVALAELIVKDPAFLLSEGKKIRFVYISGAFTNRNLHSKPWFLGDSRTMKGEVELKLEHIQNENASNFEVFFPRPAGVLQTDKGIKKMLMGPLAIGNDTLGASVTDIAVNGYKDRVIENASLRAHGRRVLSRGGNQLQK